MNSTQATESWVGFELCSGRYRVSEQFGSGGMALVYRAHDCKLESDVVLKVPRQAMLADPTFVERFRAEIRSLVKLRHPHVVSVLDVDEHGGVPFAVMQLLSGGTLLDRYEEASLADVSHGMNRWLVDIAKAIDFLHSQGFIHRDIKPENILFDEHSHAFISDFGVVKTVLATEDQNEARSLTQNGILGTPEYMAPEMILGQDFDGAVDQYALGVTVYELLAKRRPFEGDTGTAVLVAHTRDEAPRLDSLVEGLSQDFVSSLHRAIAKNPGDRFDSCEAFARTLIASLTTHYPSDASDASARDVDSTRFETRTGAGTDSGQGDGELAQPGARTDTTRADRDETTAHPVNEPEGGKKKKSLALWIAAGSFAAIAASLLFGGVAYWMMTKPAKWPSFEAELSTIQTYVDKANTSLAKLERIGEGSGFSPDEIRKVDAETLEKQWSLYSSTVEKKIEAQSKDIEDSVSTGLSLLDDFKVAFEIRSAEHVELGGSPFEEKLLAEKQTSVQQTEQLNEIEEQIDDVLRKVTIAIDGFADEIESQIDLLRTLEKNWVSTTPYQPSRDEISKATEILSNADERGLRLAMAHSLLAQQVIPSDQPNRHLSMTIELLEQEPDSLSTKEAKNALFRLCCRLLPSNPSQQKLIDCIDKHKLYQQMPVGVLLESIEESPKLWVDRSLITPTAKACRTSEHRLQLFDVQANIRDSVWLDPLSAELRGDSLLSQNAEKVTDIILESGWSELYWYPIERLVEGKLRFEDASQDLLSHLTENYPGESILVSDALIRDGTVAQFDWAMRTITSLGQRSRLGELLDSPVKRSRAFNFLTSSGDFKDIKAAQDLVIADYKGAADLDYGGIVYENLSNVIKQAENSFYRQMLVASWKSTDPKAQRWVVENILPESVQKTLRELDRSTQAMASAGNSMRAVFNEGNRRKKPKAMSPYRGIEMVYFDVRSKSSFPQGDIESTLDRDKIGELDPSTINWLSPEIDLFLERQGTALRENQSASAGYRLYPGLDGVVAEAFAYLAASSEFLESHRRLVGTCASLKGQVSGYRLYLKKDSYAALTRSLILHDEAWSQAESLRGFLSYFQ